MKSVLFAAAGLAGVAYAGVAAPAEAMKTATTTEIIATTSVGCKEDGVFSHEAVLTIIQVSRRQPHLLPASNAMSPVL